MPLHHPYQNEREFCLDTNNHEAECRDTCRVESFGRFSLSLKVNIYVYRCLSFSFLMERWLGSVYNCDNWPSLGRVSLAIVHAALVSHNTWWLMNLWNTQKDMQQEGA